MKNEYYDNYIGIVVTGASEDPEGRNRIQVWVPHLMNTLYKNWNSKEDDKVIFNLNDIPTEEIERLRNSLPWAECASPLMGGGAPFATSRTNGGDSIDTGATLTDPNDNSVLTPELGGGSGEETLPTDTGTGGTSGGTSGEEEVEIISETPTGDGDFTSGTGSTST